MAAGAEIVQLVLGIARLGCHQPITERCLSSLLAHAQDHGVEAVLGWLNTDPGYLLVSSWQFLLPWQCSPPTHLCRRVLKC